MWYWVYMSTYYLSNTILRQLTDSHDAEKPTRDRKKLQLKMFLSIQNAERKESRSQQQKNRPMKSFFKMKNEKIT